MLSVSALKKAVESPESDEIFLRLYGETQKPRARYTALLDAFSEKYGEKRKAIIVSAPGRVEIGGNHTDHNNGCVLAAAIQLDIIGVVSPNNGSWVHIASSSFPEDSVNLSDLSICEKEKGSSAALVRGIAARFYDINAKIGGFDAYTDSDVLKGSGLSSSAAFEVFVAAAFNYLCNSGSVSKIDEAKAGQFAENIYFGKPSGLMDQTASAVGGFVGIDFADPSSPIVTPVSFDFASSGHSLCVVDTGGSHADLTHEYAAIRSEMVSVANFFGKQTLRDCPPEEFYKKMAKIRKSCGDRAVLRAMHFFEDTNRALLERDALASGDFGQFLRLINESGQSSFMYNQNAYATSDPAHQGIPVGLALTQRLLCGRGAFRLQGGGFGGTIQAFVPQEMVPAYKKSIESVFGKGSCMVMRIRPDGSRTIL